MNSELQHAHLELLSAHCATHQLRLHFSTDDLARFGRRDVLRKSAEAASALSEFYAAIEKKLTPEGPNPTRAKQPTSEQIAQAVGWLSSYLRAQREHYLPSAEPLDKQYKAFMWPYFSSALLEQVRIVQLQGERVALPDFYAQARALGFDPPEVSHMDSVTFLDVIAFNEQLNERSLFHALVHTVQIQALGLERYAELWVHSFIKTRAHFTVPLEVHAFSLASRFLRPSPERFSVEDQVLRWVAEERY
ncbi:MAG TPA: hypothetical protein VFE61_01815 [Candidatus Sulfotelmatobacter sp.]|nr:hypothetical protein [Candidatus Sulfotelmatobacter sp.]